MSAVSSESPRTPADLIEQADGRSASAEPAGPAGPASEGRAPARPPSPEHSPGHSAGTDFGPNQWLVDELYQRYQADPGSVDRAWWNFFADYQPQPPDEGADVPVSPGSRADAASPADAADAVSPQRAAAPPAPPVRAAPAPEPAAGTGQDGPRVQAAPVPGAGTGQDGPRVQAAPAPGAGTGQDGPRVQAAPASGAGTGQDSPRVPADQPLAAPPSAGSGSAGSSSAAPAAAAPPAPAAPAAPAAAGPAAPAPPAGAREGRLRGAAARTALNITTSLPVPTATSVRAVPAKLLVDNRIVINNHLKRGRGGKVSFTHLIGYAVVKALKALPEMNDAYAEENGKPAIARPDHVNLGLAIDVHAADGGRQLLVPNMKAAEEMDFRQFWTTYEDVVRRARGGKLAVTDFQGTTATITNPGTIGTEHSVPRLMPGQGCIVGVGAMEYPAAYAGASEETLARLAISKSVTLTSTYDHRIIQGAQSGEFLQKIHH